MTPPVIKIEVIKGNGLGPHGNGPMARYPIGRGQTDTFYNSKPIGKGTVSIAKLGDKNNVLDTTFQCKQLTYHVEFQKYFLVKNLKVLLEKQVPEYKHEFQRLVLKGKVLEDDRELSEYGINASSASSITLQMYLLPDLSAINASAIEGPRRQSDGTRVWQPIVNATGLTGHDFSSTISSFVP